MAPLERLDRDRDFPPDAVVAAWGGCFELLSGVGLEVARLLGLNLGGIALQQWRTTGAAVSQLVLGASPEQRGEIVDRLRRVASEVAPLRQAVESVGVPMAGKPSMA
ncbi:TPA: hypothetical protein ACQTXZ_000783 [Pseudomonas aeruginosa]|uniref:hypothetical protein n=1 Tax=Pseudomonas aeruginosa TaxID=287 RepID=UPI000463F21D|nr:hypothetical protein [Pseudomonas aeruginosa]KSD36685.1 hypothetical protein AO902_14415 [Pseudomonas aeruginosa]